MEVVLEYFNHKGMKVDSRKRNDCEINLIKLHEAMELRIKSSGYLDIFISRIVNVALQSNRKAIDLWFGDCFLNVKIVHHVVDEIELLFDKLSKEIESNKTPQTQVLDINGSYRQIHRNESIAKILGSPKKYTPCSNDIKYKRISDNTTPSKLEVHKLPCLDHCQRVFEAEGHNKDNELEFLPNASQKKILNACVSGKNIFYTGGAGTGKSRLLLEILKQLELKFGKFAIFTTATTGLAACSIGGTTLHQFAGISSGIDNDVRNIVKQTLKNDHILRRFKAAKVVLIDEVSMLSSTILEAVNLIAKYARKNSLPMGGIQIIMCGDFYQLPPVINSKMMSGTALQQWCHKENNENISSNTNPATNKKFCFQGDVWKQIIQMEFELKEVYRQKGDDVFITILNEIRKGELNNLKHIQLLNECVNRQLDCQDGILPTQIFTHKKDVEELNRIELSKLPGIWNKKMIFIESVIKKYDDVGQAVRYQSIDNGTEKHVELLKHHCPVNKTIELKVGAQVILLKTIDVINGLVNGSRGVVLSINKVTSKPVVRFGNGIEKVITQERFEIKQGGKILAERMQIPLELGWGISVHKSQGMSVDKAELHLKNAFECGQIYVALSRVRSLNGLCLRYPISSNQIWAHKDVIHYYKNLNQNNKLI